MADRSVTEPVPLPMPKRISTGDLLLSYNVATNIQQVTEAWRLVYQSYVKSQLISPNPYSIHTAMPAIGLNSAVIFGQKHSAMVTTLSAFIDRCPADSRLPLDRVYAVQLDKLRSQGCQLMEVGMFADRRGKLTRSVEALYELMRYVFHFGCQNQVTDIVIGVHPHHKRFYKRSFGFEELGPTLNYPAVNNHAVQLLRGDVKAAINRQPRHPTVQHYLDNTVDQKLYADRFLFTSEQIKGTSIEAYQHYLDQHASLGQAG